MSFIEGEIVILNKTVAGGLSNRVGERCKIIENNYDSILYGVKFDDGGTAYVKESILKKLTVEDNQLMRYIFTYNMVLHKFSNELVKILKVDYILKQAEIEFNDCSNIVVNFDSLKELENEQEIEQPQQVTLGKFTEIALTIGEFTDLKNKQYGSSVDATYEMTKVLMERYTYDDENYLMPKSLLRHLLLNVRIMDKQNRLFNNPSGEGDSESPYKDVTGYGLIGVDMVAK